MAGIMGSKNFELYRKEMAKVVSENKHNQLMEIDPEYRKAWENFKESKHIEQRMHYKKIMAKIAASYQQDLKFTKSKANRDKLIISCLPMVVNMAKRFIGRAKGGVYMDDLIQAGNLGLVIAADKYINTPVPVGKKEAKFSTIAYMWVYKFVREEMFKLSTPFGGASVRGAEAAMKNANVFAQKFSKDGEDFDNDTWDDSTMNKLLDLKEFKIVSDEVKAFRESSKKLFSVLSKEEKRILFMAYGIDTPNNVVYSQKEIAKMLGTSEPTISRRIASCLRKLSYSTRNSISGVELITALAQLHSVDMSQIPEWTMADTY